APPAKTTASAALVAAAPVAITSSAEGFTIADENAGPERRPIPAKNSTSPSCRSVSPAVYGGCQTSGPVRPAAPSASPTTSGPPAEPSENDAPPGNGIASEPSPSPAASPTPSVSQSTSASARYESPK